MEGKQIGNFRIIQKIGEGGMGVVYKGIDVQLDRPVAIKMLNVELSRNPELVQRFQAEARAQANLNHTNVATLYAFLVTDEGACMVMEFVEGESFEQILRRTGPINPRDAVPLFKQALLGIGAAHRMGIIHRDIKPANLMVNRQGIVKVMDFGIAKAVGTRGMTRTGMQMGTILYMSPEQIQSRTIDGRTDIYALGVTLYEMLCGHVPFESESDFQVMHDHVNTPPPPLTRYYPYAAREFENVVAKALEKSPDNRFQTVEEFGAALEHPENVPPPVFAYAPPPSAAMRGTTIEQHPLSAAGYGAAPAMAPGFTPVPRATPPGTPPPYGTAPGAQPGFTPPYGTAPGTQPGFTPPYGTAPGTQPGFTPPSGTASGMQPGFTPPPVEAPVQTPAKAPMSGRNKLILGGVALVIVAGALLAVVLRPTSSTPATGGTGGGGGGGTAGTTLAGNTTGPVAPHGDGSTINVVKGDATTPGSNPNPNSSSSTPTAAGATKDVRTPRQKTPATPVKQPQSVQPQGQATQQPQQPQPQPTPQAQQPPPQPTPQVQQPPPQPTPQPQPTPVPRQQAQAQSFPVKHRHVVMNGFQSYTFFCGGWLSIRPDGSVTYACTATNDPSGRCDKVMFAAGSIKQAKMKAAGELHISTSGMGNWDFFDLNVAGATSSAYQAILSLGR